MHNMWLCPQLDWPTDLFAEANEAANAAARLPSRDKGRTDDRLCHCGCGLPHNFAVSRLTDNRQVQWYRAMTHRNRAAGLH